MSETEVFNISIPTDEDGQVLLKCSVCNDLFKVDGSVYGDDDSVFEIHCPSCGIVNPVDGWSKGKISIQDALEQSNISESTFYRRVREYRAMKEA